MPLRSCGRCNRERFVAPDLCEECSEVLAVARAVVTCEWKVWRSALRASIRGKLRAPRPAANLSAAVAPVDRALAHTLILDYAGERPVTHRTSHPTRFNQGRQNWCCAVPHLQQFGDYCAFHRVNQRRGAYSAWLHSRGDLVVAVTPTLAEARSGARFDWSLSTRRDFTMFFHRVVLDSSGALTFPSGFSFSDLARAIITRYVKRCVDANDLQSTLIVHVV